MKQCVKCGNTYNAQNLAMAKDDQYKLKSGFYFFNFPSSAKLRKEWSKKLDLPKNLKLLPDNVVCSAHFSFSEAIKLANKQREPVHDESIESLSSSSEMETEYLEEDDEEKIVINEVEPGELDNTTTHVVIEEVNNSPDDSATLINGVAMFSCSVCPALFISKSAFDDHVFLRGSTWNTVTHTNHVNDFVGACKRVARKPTMYGLEMNDGAPTIIKKAPAEHNYVHRKSTRKGRSKVDESNEEDDSTPLFKKLIPNLVPRRTNWTTQTHRKRLLTSLNGSQKGNQRKRNLDVIIAGLTEEAAERDYEKKLRYILPKRNGLLKVLKDGKVMRERSFI